MTVDLAIAPHARAALGDAVQIRRRELRLTRQQVYGRGGPSAPTLVQIEQGNAAKMRPSTLRKLDCGLDWPLGTASRVLAGERPAEVVEVTYPRSPTIRDPLDMSEAGEAAGVLGAIADPIRLGMLSIVAAHADGEACEAEIDEVFALSVPSNAAHLRALCAAGLLEPAARGAWTYYRVTATARRRVDLMLDRVLRRRA